MSQGSARDSQKNSQLVRGRAPGSGSHRAIKRPIRSPSAPASSRVSPQGEQASVQEYLDRFATALTSGDTKAMAKLWGVPAFVIGATEARVVQSESEVEQFFGGAKDLYNERGIVGTRAEITDLDWVAEDLVIVTVRWPYLDGNDRVLGAESSSYTLLRGENGSFKLRVITLRGEGEPIARSATDDTGAQRNSSHRATDEATDENEKETDDGTDGE